MTPEQLLAADPLWPMLKAQARRLGVSLFGAGSFARAVAAALRARGVVVHAFLTSGQPAATELDSVPLRQINPAELAHAPVWIGVFNREAHSDYAALAHTLQTMQPAVELVWPQAFYGGLAAELGFRFWLQPLAAYAQPEVQAHIAQARSLLADDASRAAWDAVLAFRTQPAVFAQSPQPQGEVQYLPTWLRAHFKTQGVQALKLVDGGAYRGETVRELHALMPVEQAWTFEPDAENYAHLVRHLADFPAELTHVPAGLSDASGFAGFTPGMQDGCHLSAHGTHHVPVVSLDDCLHRAKPNFIKFDLEGHEMAALAGCRAMLLRQRPTLAIAGYHRWDDVWRIPQFIQSLDVGYNIRIGLHASNSFEMVIYVY